jgi:class 3 adenylate cyclase
LLGKIKILKNTGDGYLFFSDEISADGLILKIFDFYEAVNRYNAGIKDELYKLNVRFSLHKGVVYEKNTLSGKDYFGKDLNILYRILDNTPADHIYISESVYKSLKDIDIKRRFIYFGEVQLKGIVETINLYASF